MQPVKTSPKKSKHERMASPTATKPDSKLSKYISGGPPEPIPIPQESPEPKHKLVRERKSAHDPENSAGKRNRGSSATRKQWNRKPKNEEKPHPSVSNKLMQPILKSQNSETTAIEPKNALKSHKPSPIQQDDQGQEKHPTPIDPINIPKVTNFPLLPSSSHNPIPHNLTIYIGNISSQIICLHLSR
jgi:hypothetical protein